MSNPSSKARFYLEQAVPQLQEFEQKKIFTKVSLTLNGRQVFLKIQSNLLEYPLTKPRMRSELS
jgi:hypothetical protein